MDLLTGYEMSVGARTRETFGLGGTAAVAAVDRTRAAHSPRRSVFLDERAKRGEDRGPAGRGTYQSGLLGEETVADGLRRAGWRVLGQRVRTRVGEIDIVARRGDSIVFVEVKTAMPGRIGVEHAVDGKQRHRIRRAAVAWMASNPRLQRGVNHYRFDVFIVRRDSTGTIERIDQVRDAF